MSHGCNSPSCASCATYFHCKAEKRKIQCAGQFYDVPKSKRDFIHHIAPARNAPQALEMEMEKPYGRDGQHRRWWGEASPRWVHAGHVPAIFLGLNDPDQWCPKHHPRIPCFGDPDIAGVM